MAAEAVKLPLTVEIFKSRGASVATITLTWIRSADFENH